MSSNKGWPSSQKTTNQIYQTIQPLGAGKHGADVLPKAMSALTLIDQVPEATSGVNFIDLAGHIVKAGDMIRFTAGNLDREEVAVYKVTTNRIYLSHSFDSDITPADTFIPLRAVTLTISKEGGLSTSSGPVQFILDGAAQLVIEDTVTPANNTPLPVKLTGATGDINITAGDLNVQTSHVGANYDSQRIGDGTNLMAVNASNEATVHDEDVKTALDTILTQVQKPTVLAGYFGASLAITNGARTAALVTVPASTLATELEIICKNGETFSAYSDAAGTNFIGRFTNGGGKLPISLAAAGQIFLEADSATFTASELVINLIGVGV